MPETATYTALVAKNLKQAAADMSKVLHVDLEVEQGKVANIANTDKGNSFGLFSTEFIRRHGLHLSGTTEQPKLGSSWTLLITVKMFIKRTSSSNSVDSSSK
ncbi:hypothetical protein SLE2022_250890 [Rubroshorea leprosula]